MRRVTLTQFLIEQQRKGLMGADLRLLMEVVARAVKAIAVNVSKGALAGVLGEAGSDNVQGEAQKKLDVIANDILIQANEWGGHLAAMASEEVEEIQPISSDYPKGGYFAAVRSPRRFVQHRREYLRWHDLLGAAQPRRFADRDRG